MDEWLTTSPNMSWMGSGPPYLASPRVCPSNAFDVTAIFFLNDSQTKYILYESLSVASLETLEQKLPSNAISRLLAVAIF